MEKGKNKNGRMTLDKLTVMVAKGLNEISSKIATKEEMNVRFKEVDSRFNKLENKIESYTSFWHRKFSEHEAWLQSLDKSVASLERIVGKK